MNEQETITDIIAVMRKTKYGDEECQVKWCLTPWADRLEAALKRERGDCAKLREALKETQFVISKCMDILNKIPDKCGHGGLLDDVADELCALREDHVKSALSSPPRNCDVPLVVDGPADNNADKAWLVFKQHNPDAYFDVPGLLRCIDWLFAPATEKEGGKDGNE